MTDEFDPDALFSELGKFEPEKEEEISPLTEEEVLDAIKSTDLDVAVTRVNISEKSIRITLENEMSSGDKETMKDALESVVSGRKISFSTSGKPAPPPLSNSEMFKQVEELIDKRGFMSAEEIQKKGLITKSEVADVLEILCEEESDMMKRYIDLYKDISIPGFQKWLIETMNDDFMLFVPYLERIYRFINRETVEQIWRDFPELGEKWANVDGEDILVHSRIPTIAQMRAPHPPKRNPFAKMGTDAARFKDMLDLMLQFVKVQMDGFEKFVPSFKDRMAALIKDLK